MEAAPSARPLIWIPAIGLAGEVRLPEESNVMVPELNVVGVPVPPVADAGRVMA